MNAITKTGLSPTAPPNRHIYDPNKDMRNIDFKKFVNGSPDHSAASSESSSEPSRGCNGSARSSSVDAPPGSPASLAAAHEGSTSSQES